MLVRARVTLRSVREIEALLEGLALVAQAQLMAASREGRPLPPLYSSGVRYRREIQAEEWLGPREVYAQGNGDCEDLVAWRVAELRLSGENAKPECYSPRDGLVHCVVRVNGRREDPSARLGMGKE